METLGGGRGIEVRRKHDRGVRYVPQNGHGFCSFLPQTSCDVSRDGVEVFSTDACRGFEAN